MNSLPFDKLEMNKRSKQDKNYNYIFLVQITITYIVQQFNDSLRYRGM